MSGLLGDLLLSRWRVRQRDDWTRAQLEDFQAERLAQLRQYALRHSPHFAERYRGLEGAPLAELPPLTKSELMASWDPQPIDQLVTGLNNFRPRLLVCYASMLAPLAEAQLAGSLRIGPEKVITASEDQLAPARQIAMEACGVEVINTYAATETATIASMCSHGSMHVYEDFLVVEPVDNHYQSVPDGQVSDRLLVTVLFSRTLPLIRYELTDSVCLATAPCPCGSPFKVLESVAGRTEATLQIRAAGVGVVSVRPNVFHDAIEQIAVHGWQVEQHETGVTVRVVDPAHNLDDKRLAEDLRVALMAAGVGAEVSIGVERVSQLARSRLGKAPLIVGLPRPRKAG